MSSAPLAATRRTRPGGPAGDGSALSLEYAVLPTPYPVRASVSGANPNYVDLQVTISPPGAAVTLTEFIVTIPVGSTTEPGDLSPATDLPQPTNLTGADGWTVSAAGSDIAFRGPGTVAGPISFTLPQIAVSEVSGTVVIDATELPPGGDKVDLPAASLFKEAADFPVSSYSAVPSAVYDVDETVTLFWTCTDQGKDCVYSLSSGTWLPRDCMNAGQCYTCDDGARGVQSPQIQTTSAFELDVIQSGSGGRSIIATLTLTVPVLTPTVLDVSYVEQLPIVGGRYASLHWVALNASSCTVRVDGAVVAEQAPADTYLSGFLVDLGAPGTHQVTVEANALQGSAKAEWNPGEYTVNGGWETATDFPPVALAATPDGRVAAAMADPNTLSNRSYLVGIDPANQQVGAPISFFMPPTAMCGTPAGPWGVVLCPSQSQVFWYDLDSTAGDGGARMNPDPVCIISMPDGQTCLAGFDDQSVGVFAPGQSSPQPVVGLGAAVSAVATAPPGTAATLGLAATSSPNQVALIDLAAFTVEADRIPLPAAPGAMAVTPDGSLALVLYPSTGAVGVVDIASRTLEANAIDVGGTPAGIAITPDGSLAFVADSQNARVVAIGLASRSVLGSGISVAQDPVAVAVTSDGAALVVACAAPYRVQVY